MPMVIAAELELARFLASQPSAEAIIAFHPSPEIAARYYDLLELERAGRVSADERTELDTYLGVERLVQLIKTEARSRLAQQAPRAG
ncbi:MAG TPA: hypothetical protein VH349_13045 [Ktedonobacterales bacterium]